MASAHSSVYITQIITFKGARGVECVCVCWPVLTLVAVPHGVEVHVVFLVGEEEEAEPGVEGVDGHDEEDPDDVSLLVRRAVETQVHVDLGGGEKQGAFIDPSEGKVHISIDFPFHNTKATVFPVAPASPEEHTRL